MNEVYNIVGWHLQKGLILNQQAIMDIINALANDRQLYSYISGISFEQILDEKGRPTNIWGKYTSDNRLVFDIVAVINSVMNGGMINPYLKQINIINFQILFVVFHELRHVEQKRDMHEKRLNPITRYIVNDTVKMRQKKKYLYDTNHNDFPLEKDADICAYEQIIMLFRNYNNYLVSDYEINYLNILLLKRLIEGYVPNISGNPLKNLIILQNENLSEAVLAPFKYELYKKIIETSGLSVYERLAYNLPITQEEYDTIEHIIECYNCTIFNRNLEAKRLILGR